MRRRRPALFALPIVFGALLLAVWLIPPQLDWARYRGTIARLAADRLGLPVTIGGPVHLRLLPEPVLTAGRVSVGNPAHDDMLIRVRALRLGLGLWPLLAGRIDARTVVLRHPDLHIPWPTRPGALPIALPVGLPAFSARIEDGSLSVGQFAVTGIDGTLSNQQGGALEAAVAADIAGQRWSVAAQLSDAGPDGASAVTLRLRGEGRAAGITAGFTGHMAASGALEGKVSAAGPDLSLLLPTPALNFQAQGRLTIADGLAEMDELQTRLDGLPAIAAVALNLLPHPRLDVALSASRLNLDPWVPLLSREPAERRLPIGLDISADAATLAGATLQHVRATFELRPGAVQVEQAAAEIPGNAMLRLAGRIDRTGGSGPVFTGTGRIEAPVLRTTLQWLLPDARDDLAALPADMAQQANLAGKLLLQPDRVAISALDGELDGDTLRGDLDWKMGKPPSVAADLQLGRMGLEPWLGQGVAATRLRQLLLHRLNADLRLRVTQASFDGIPIDGLTLHAATLGGSVSLHQLQAQVLGAQLTAGGSFSAKGEVSDGHLKLTTANALPLADLLPEGWRATPALWFGPAQLEIAASGPRDAVASSVTLRLGDLRLDLQPTFNLAAGTATGSITAQHPNAGRLISELGLPARLGLDGVPVWLGEGSMSLVARLGVGPQPRISLDDGELVAGRLHTRLNLALDVNGSQPVLTGSLAAETLPLPVPGPGPLPVALLKGWQAKLQVTADRVLSDDATLLRGAGATVQLQHDTLSLEQISGKLGGGILAASASLDTTQQPPVLAVQGKLTGATVDRPVLALPIDVTAGKADLSLSLRAAGYGTNALTASLAGVLKADVQDGMLSGFDLAALRDRLKQPGGDFPEQSLQEPLDGGQTSFQLLTLQGEVAHGILSLVGASLSGTDGTAEASGTVSLPDTTADLRLVLRPAMPQGPSIPVLVSGALGTPSRTPQLADVVGWWSARRVH